MKKDSVFPFLPAAKPELIMRLGTPTSTAEQGRNNANDFEDFRLENGSRQGQKLALNVLYVPSSLDSGRVWGEFRVES